MTRDFDECGEDRDGMGPDEPRGPDTRASGHDELGLPPPSRDLAAELRLRPERPPVTRLSRRALATLGGTAAVGVAAALMFALWPHGQKSAGSELLSTENRGTPEGLNGLPHDYSGLPKSVPRLGPPLPGDLGRPILNAGAPSPGMPQPAAPAQPDPETQRRAQERTRLAQELQAARASRLFASKAHGTPQGSDAESTPAQVATGAGPATAPPSPSSVQAAQPTEADRKLAFVNAPVDRRMSSPDGVERLVSRNVVQAGSAIPAAMITGLRSDLPGQIVAQVTEPVYDSPTGRVLLIPQGAKLIGQYDAQVTFGQSRALLVWNRVVMPNGQSVVLERQPGADPAGYAGLQDGVDNHWGQLFKAALVSTILSVGAEAGTSNDENNLVQAIRRGSSDAIGQAGRQVVGRSLNVQPTLTVRPGFPVRVIVTRDLVIDPYRD